MNANGLLWVYDRHLHTFKEVHPDSICFKKDLYSFQPEGKPVDTGIETKIMAIVDGLWGAAIERLEERRGLDRDSFDAFTLFAGLQY